MFEVNKSIRKKDMIGPRCREAFLPLLAGGPLARLGVELAGVSLLRGEYCMHRPHLALCSVIVGTLEGRGLLTTDDGTRFLGPGDLLVVSKGMNCRYETIRGQAWKIVWFNLRCELPVDRVRVWKADYLAAMAADMRDVTAEASAGLFLSDEARMGKESYLAALAQRILHYEKRGQQVLQEARLQVLWRAVMSDLTHKWRLPELARSASYSPEHLNRICNQWYGVSAMHYLTRLRMRNAAHLLGQDTHKIRMIGELCGYDNPFAFSVAFKRHYGFSPKQFLAKSALQRSSPVG